MTKPIGAVCNLNCHYCFYLEKQALFPARQSYRMSDEVLENYVRQYIESQPTDEVTFSWQGGEPTLLGVGFFEKVIAWQTRYAGGKRISNALQTNGTLLDDNWGAFLHRHNFLVGISIDGPAHLHDAYRQGKKGQPSFAEVMRGVEVLRRHRVEFNTLTVVNRLNSRWPLLVYRFLKEIGSGFMQFIPVVERVERKDGPTLAGPPGGDGIEHEVTPWSVRPEDYGSFLSTIFKEWSRKDVGRVFVQLFDVTLGAWTGAPSGLCVHAPNCGRGVAMESNGDLYACDHYVYPDYRLGNMLETDLRDMVDSARQQAFGRAKSESLPAQCRQCRYLFACYGGCPKHRFSTTADGEPGLNYLCAGYRRFFRESRPKMEAMADLLARGRAPAEIMNRRR